MYAPIVLFVYNRPDHTKRTLEALEKNQLSDQSYLYIYADGLKEGATEKEINNIESVKKLLHSRQWCKEVQIIEREENWGLANNIVDGVTSVVNKYGKVIVLEDDIFTSPGFLQYMNDALDLYQKENKVKHISAYQPVLGRSREQLPKNFFLKFMSCWGWGTWQRAWADLILDPIMLISKISQTNKLDEFNLDNTISLSGQLEDNITGKIQTWAAKWAASIFIQEGLCLYPNQSLVENIGLDGSGEHCGKDSKKKHSVCLTNAVEVKKISITESQVGRKYLTRFYNNASKRSFYLILYQYYARNLRWLFHSSVKTNKE